MNVSLSKLYARLRIRDFDKDNRSIEIVRRGQNIKEVDDRGQHFLNLYSSIFSNSHGTFSTGVDQVDPEKTNFHQVNWQFGISLPQSEYHRFNWVKELRPERSICIQFIISVPPGNFECSVVSADLAGFKPLARHQNLWVTMGSGNLPSV